MHSGVAGGGASTQNPLVQTCAVPQSVLPVHAFWHSPLTQRPPGPHSSLNWHARDGSTSTGVLHCPLQQVAPVGQSESTVHVVLP